MTRWYIGDQPALAAHEAMSRVASELSKRGLIRGLHTLKANRAKQGIILDELTTLYAVRHPFPAVAVVDIDAATERIAARIAEMNGVPDGLFT